MLAPSKHLINADLHCHSVVSDGVLTPTELAKRAHANGVEVWALTDHDEIRGIDEARAAAHGLGMQFIAGVEISVTWAGTTIHVVGLNVDENNAELVAGLERTRSGRQRRAEDMAQDLARVGIHGTYEGALKYVGNPDLISRSHFARYLVEAGVSPDISSVFKHYLSEGKPGYVPHRWATLGEAMSWIRGAGGTPVVAHPGRYPLSPVALDVFFNEFKGYGGQAIEVVTGSHSIDQYAEFTQIAKRYGFWGSRGSDFHAPDDDSPDLGRLPALDKSLNPVWHEWV